MIRSSYKHLAISLSFIALSLFILFNINTSNLNTGEQRAQVGGDVGVQPHRQREGVNLVANHDFSVDPLTTIGTTNWSWYLLNGAEYDPTTTRTSGSGSLKFSDGMVYSKIIPVTPGKSYTFSAYMKSSAWPTLITMFASAHDANKKFIYNLSSGPQVNTVADKWEEIVLVYTAKEGEMYMSLNFHWKSLGGIPAKGTVWIDDVYFGEGVGFEQPPTSKKTFDGSSFRVDELGNFQKWNGVSFESFLPFCICPDNYRQDYSVYVKAGFNCITWSGSLAHIQKAKDNGMVAGIEVGGYASFGHWNYKKFDKLKQSIIDVHSAGLDDSALMYYFDNETYRAFDPDNPMDMWTVTRDVLELINSTELSINGGRNIRPRYMLIGNEGIARMYSGYIDLVGDYVGLGSLTTFGPSGLSILDNIEGQNVPLFAQINPHKDGNTPMRKIIYQYLISGAKGFSFWMDKAPNNPSNEYDKYNVMPIEQTPWYTELPKVRQEVEQLNHVFSRPHWVSWRAQSNYDSVIIGGRDYQGEAYLILVNERAVSSPIQFTVSGLNYTPNTVQDAFTGEMVASFTGNSFSYSFGNKETAVLKLVVNSEPTPIPDTTPAPSLPTPTPASNPTPTPTPTPPPPPGATNGLCATTLNSCREGSYSDREDTSTKYNWSCLGLNGGYTASCSLDRFLPPINNTPPNTNRPTNTSTYRPGQISTKINYQAPTINIPTTTVDISMPKLPSWLDFITAFILDIVSDIIRGVKRTGEMVGM